MRLAAGRRARRRDGDEAVRSALDRGADLAAEDFDSLGKLRKATGVPLAAGENATGRLEFVRMAAAGIDYVQPSAVKNGITAQWEICRTAEQSGVTCVPHSL